MAIMIPDTPRNFAAASLEGLMFDALQKLPNDYYIFHSFRMISVTNNTLHESETDFVIFNQKYGIICLEAKAGAVEYKDGSWFYASGIKMKHEGPFVQASLNKHKLRQYIERSHSAPLLDKCKFLHGVWFPSITAAMLNSMAFPPDADKNIVLTKEALDNPEPYLGRIYALGAQKKISTALTDDDVKRMMREVLCPHFNVFPTATFENDLKKMVFHRLLKEQSGILNFLSEQKTAVINGAAGTGKTMIAIEKAQRHANEGEKVLFLCFNTKLRDFLESNYSNCNIDFFTIASLACKKCNSLTANYSILKSWLDDMFFHGKFPYKHIIVDEGQDFGADGIDELEILELLRDIVKDESVNGTFYVFYDRLQLVQAKQIPKYIEDADCKLTLYRNCRNTENIATTSLKVFPKRKPTLIEGGVKGVPANIYYRTAETSITCLDEVIKEFVSNGIKNLVVLTCKTESESILANVARNGKYQDKYLFTTCRKFKGLEADGVILIDVTSETFNSQNAMLFYVGTSRARIRLGLIAQLNDNDCREILTNCLKFDGKIRNPRRELASALNSIGMIE